MDDYIKREAALALVRPDAPEDEKAVVTIATAKKLVRSIVLRTPAADVAPVVQGEWEAVDRREYDADSCKIICYPKDGIACTHCRYVFKKDALWKKNFCPNCGARMDGGVE